MQFSSLVYLPRFLIVFKFAAIAAAITVYGPCITPTDEIAQCVDLKDCTFLFALLRKTPLSDKDRHYLRASQCGNTYSDVYICCPDEYINFEISTTMPTSSATPTIPTMRIMPTTTTTASTTTLAVDEMLEDNILPKPPVCGTFPNNKVNKTEFNNFIEHPWTALLVHTDEYNKKVFVCGGSLITNQHVITAAHCITKISMDLSSVRLGEWDTRTEQDCTIDSNGHVACFDRYVDVAIESRIIHEKYNSNDPTSPNDIAILRLKDKVNFTDFIKPICLLTAPELSQRSFEDFKMTIVGWGYKDKFTKSTVKNKGTVTVWKQLDCRQAFCKKNKIIDITSKQICAGGSAVYPCNGDSGSSLVIELEINNTQAFYLAGVVSFGIMDCEVDTIPTVYTRVMSFIDWILENVNATAINQD